MSRPLRAPALVALALIGAVGCQDYNFNPVGHCLIQPGTKRFTLSGVDTADVLFVVDDSGSMAAEQDKLALGFQRFITNLSNTNTARAGQGLEPFKYHLAITTSSVFENEKKTVETCTSACPGAAGQQVCCLGTAPARQPRRCATLGATGTECPVSGTVCSDTCSGRMGELFCCASGNPGAIPPDAFTELIPCSRPNAECGKLQTHYSFNQSCIDNSSRWGSGATGPGPAIGNGWPYPHGQFVSWVADAASPNPRVLHFDERLYKTSPQVNSQGFSLTDLQDFFRENVRVGTCGSGQEQALQAARLALQNAQKDTYTYVARTPEEAPQTTTEWSAAKRTPLANASWPNQNKDGSPAKMVIVFVGDEDDCSSPEDPSAGIVMETFFPAEDACTADPTTSNPKLFPPSQFAEFFTSLNRPVAAAFIFSTATTPCSGEGCTPGFCVQPNCSGPDCGGQAPGSRLHATATALKARGVDVVLGSMCDEDFDDNLDNIAEIVKPPQTLALPTPPAEDAVTMLRIARPDGTTRKVCGRPLAPGTYATVGAAEATRADWWFTATEDPGPPVALSQYVYINPQGSCGLNAGETWSADYLGIVPAPSASNPEGGCLRSRGTDSQGGSIDCRRMLGGSEGAFDCFAPDGGDRGTCTCRGS